MAKIAVAYCLHDDRWFLKDSIASFLGAGDVYVFANDVPWAGSAGDWRAAANVARQAGANVVEGSWPAEVLHRQGALIWLQERGYTHAILPEPDEIAEPGLVESLIKVALTRLAQRVTVEAADYWKRPNVVVRARDRLTPTLMVEIAQVCIYDAWTIDGRVFYGGRPLFLSSEHGTLHRLSFVGPDERIERKLQAWSGPGALVPGWWGRVWKAWDDDRLVRDLHPFLPLFDFAERIPTPLALADAIEDQGAYERSEPIVAEPCEWPPVAAVVIVRDDPEGLAACVRGLSEYRDLVPEAVVVDAGSTDETPEVARFLPDVQVIELGGTRGLETARNAGFERSQSPLVLFLTPGTILPRASLEVMIESLMRSGTIAAVGPLSSGGLPPQRIEPTYTSMGTLGLFAEDLAGRSEDDVEVDTLGESCLLVRRSTLSEIGPFAEELEPGISAVDELCFRLKRAGYRSLVCTRGYFHHLSSREASPQ